MAQERTKRASSGRGGRRLVFAGTIWRSLEKFLDRGHLARPRCRPPPSPGVALSIRWAVLRRRRCSTAYVVILSRLGSDLRAVTLDAIVLGGARGACSDRHAPAACAWIRLAGAASASGVAVVASGWSGLLHGRGSARRPGSVRTPEVALLVVGPGPALIPARGPWSKAVIGAGGGRSCRTRALAGKVFSASRCLLCARRRRPRSPLEGAGGLFVDELGRRTRCLPPRLTRPLLSWLSGRTTVHRGEVGAAVDDPRLVEPLSAVPLLTSESTLEPRSTRRVAEVLGSRGALRARRRTLSAGA